jgi:hypothetical protein
MDVLIWGKYGLWILIARHLPHQCLDLAIENLCSSEQLFYKSQRSAYLREADQIVVWPLSQLQQHIQLGKGESNKTYLLIITQRRN